MYVKTGRQLNKNFNLNHDVKRKESQEIIKQDKTKDVKDVGPEVSAIQLSNDKILRIFFASCFKK